MPEIDVTGMNALTFPYVATWHWHVALYLFIGGLVAGLMIFSPSLRLLQIKGFEKAAKISDWLGLPLLAVGMLFLWLDLAQRWNAWRFFTAFQVTSAMSWGSWILLVSMALLGLRWLIYIPLPNAPVPKRRWQKMWRFGWNQAWRAGQLALRRQKNLDTLTILFGVGLGLYTGILLNTIPARPLWNSSILPFLFLSSGLASGCAFLCLFLAKTQVKQLIPLTIVVAVVELALIFSYILTLSSGTGAAQQAGQLFLSGVYASAMWGVVVFTGLFVPVMIETLEISRRRLPEMISRLAPVFTLIGGISLRFVVVYAGLHSYV